MGSVAIEGFDRTQLLALFDLYDIPPTERPELWSALADLEDEYRAIRSAEYKRQESKDKRRTHK